jgi:hypothetical protein
MFDHHLNNNIFSFPNDLPHLQFLHIFMISHFIHQIHFTNRNYFHLKHHFRLIFVHVLHLPLNSQNLQMIHCS